MYFVCFFLRMSSFFDFSFFPNFHCAKLVFDFFFKLFWEKWGLLRCTTESGPVTVHMIFVIVVHSTSVPTVSFGIEILHVYFFVIFRNHWFFLCWQQFFKFWNDSGVYRVGEFHIELDNELPLFKGITVCWHALTKNTFQVSG